MPYELYVRNGAKNQRLNTIDEDEALSVSQASLAIGDIFARSALNDGMAQGEGAVPALDEGAALEQGANGNAGHVAMPDTASGSRHGRIARQKMLTVDVQKTLAEDELIQFPFDAIEPFESLKDPVLVMDAKGDEESAVDMKQFLEKLTTEKNIEKWSVGRKDLQYGHHKLGKANFCAIVIRMPTTKQIEFRERMGLSSKLDDLIEIARLPFNIISAKSDNNLVQSSKRSDDPMHNQAAILRGEEWQDYVHTPGGSLTPRSQESKNIAYNVIKPAQERHSMGKVKIAENREAGELTIAESDLLIEAAERGMAWNYKLEGGDFDRPSHHSDNIWGQSEDGKFFKKPFTLIEKNLSPEDWELFRNAVLKKHRERNLKSLRDRLRKNNKNAKGRWVSDQEFGKDIPREERGRQYEIYLKKDPERLRQEVRDMIVEAKEAGFTEEELDINHIYDMKEGGDLGLIKSILEG